MQIAFFVVQGFNALDLAGPLQVFATSNDLESGLRESEAFELCVMSLEGGPIEASSGLPIITQRAPDQIATDGILIVVGGQGTRIALDKPEIVNWIARNGVRAATLCSVCTGALLLGKAGLLDGKKATTHWRERRRLAIENPEARVGEDHLYIVDGNLWTSAGVSAGIDMALGLLAELRSNPHATQVAQQLVLQTKRRGLQSQFSPTMISMIEGVDHKLEDLLAWASENLQADLSTPALAARMGQSERNFHRRFLERLGETPANAISSIKASAALDLLSGSDLTLKAVATRTGFSSEAQMNRAMQKHFGLSSTQARATRA